MEFTRRLVLTQYADSAVLVGAGDETLTALVPAGWVAETIRATPRARDLLGVRPVFPTTVLRLADPPVEVVRSRFTVRAHKCDFLESCAARVPGLPPASHTSGLAVHWSGAVRYKLRWVKDGRQVDVAAAIEIDWLYLVRETPGKPVFVAASPALGRFLVQFAPALNRCATKGYVVPPANARPPVAADFDPPTGFPPRADSRPCPV